MDQFRAQVTMQMNRFLLIQNAAEDASEGSSDTVSRHLLTTRLEVLEANWAKFRKEHDKLCLEFAERIEEEVYVKHRTYERCQEFYVQAKAVLLEQQEMKETSNSSSRLSVTSTPDVRSGSRRANLPKIKLPSFSGDYSTWRSFHDLFTSMVGDNHDLSNVEKMHYLKTCLTGDAARLVTNLKVNEDTFPIAWKTLVSRYENKRVLISAQLDRLFRLKPIKSKSAQELNTMIATVTESLGALEALQCCTSSWDPLVVHLMARLLDSDTREAWEVKLGPSTSYPTWKEFEEFVTGHSRAWESLAFTSIQSGKEKGRSSYGGSKVDAKSRSLVAVAPSSKGGSECRVCKSSHFLSNCPTYLAQPFEKRKRTALRLNLCFNCLGNHIVSRCPSSRRCKKCGSRHHTTLHNDIKPEKPVTKVDSNTPVDRASTSLSSKVSSGDHKKRIVSQKPLTLLATCQVQIRTRDGELVNARALLDPGSELSFIAENLVQRLRLSRKAAAIPLLGIGGTRSGRTRGSVDIVLHSLFNIADSYALQVFILPRLTYEIPSFDVSNSSWTHLNDLSLADPDFGKPGPIHIIIGADHYGQIIKPELRRGEPSSPIAQLTLFGWAVSGPVALGTRDLEGGIYHCHVDRDLQNLLTCFWKQEEISEAAEKSLSPDESDCEAQFRSTVSRDSSGRYLVRLPLRSPATLGDSTVSALRCFSRLRKRFERDPSYCKLYTDFLKEYQALGHMIPVPESEIDSFPVFYLPHHGVLRENSKTTKLRVVFNGSSPTSSGVSLNDILLPGAKLQTNIFDVLLRFRSHQYVFSSDITKMYRQILVHADDQNLQRILWLDSEGQLRSYKLTTVTYGLNCAPFLALRVIQQLIEDEGHRFPKAIPSLSKERYVDDIFGGAESVDELQEIMTQVYQLCMAGGFPLQKWSSNCPNLLDNSSSSSTDHPLSAVELDSSGFKVLGLYWQPKTDDFRFSSLPPTTRSFTKRSILSEIAQLYDPLGLIAPVVVRAKIFIQELWLAKVDWDTPLSLELQNRWTNYRQ